VLSGAGTAHMVAGSLGFLALVAAFGVLARHHRAEGRTGWAWYSALTGLVFLVAFAGLASGSGSTSPVVTLSFWTASALAFAGLTATAVRELRVSSGA
jgi:hypothetical protein